MSRDIFCLPCICVNLETAVSTPLFDLADLVVICNIVYNIYTFIMFNITYDIICLLWSSRARAWSLMRGETGRLGRGCYSTQSACDTTPAPAALVDTNYGFCFRLNIECNGRIVYLHERTPASVALGPINTSRLLGRDYLARELNTRSSSLAFYKATWQLCCDTSGHSLLQGVLDRTCRYLHVHTTAVGSLAEEEGF